MRDQFKQTLSLILARAQREGRDSLEITAGQLHRNVGGYPGSNHRMPVCCGVMLAEMEPEGPDSRPAAKG